MNYIEELKAKVKKENNVFIAPGAVVIGNVTLGENVSVWFNAVIRADRDTITIGRGTNIQDGCIIHEDREAPVISVGELSSVTGPSFMARPLATIPLLACGLRC